MRKGMPDFITQLYVGGDRKQIERDGLFRHAKNRKAAESLIVDFKKMKQSKIGELTANFDIVLGFTPEDKDHQ